MHLKEHHAARRYTLRVSRRDGAVHVTMPKGADRCQAISLVAANLEFIGRERNRLAPPVPFAPGALVPMDGHDITLVRGGDKGPATRYDPERRELAVKGEGNRFAWRTEQWLRETARRRLIDQCTHYSELVGLAPCRISLR
ncbi:MAG: YgjP-like metallopeptidase domain-containing protein, partial [Pseudomonadota bacterium]